MKEFKGTPGPWLVEGRTLYALQDSDHPILDKENRFSAGFYAHKGCSESEIAANLRLCESAPELLEALRQLQDYVEDMLSAYNYHWVDESHPMSLARAAIAKALGETK